MRNRLALVLLGVGLVPGVAVAQLPAQGVAINVDAPDTCPQREAVRSMVRELLGANIDAGEPLFAQVRIGPKGDGFELELDTLTQAGRGVRRLESASCMTLAETAALLIAIVHDPDVDVSRAISEEPKAPAPTEPAPLVPQPKPEVVATQPIPAEPLVSTLPPLEPISQLGFVGAVGVGLGALELPGAHPLVSASVGLRIEDYRIEGGLEASFGARAELESTDEKGANFSLIYAVVSGCRAIVPWEVDWPRPVETVDLGACVGVELGSMGGEGFGIADPAAGSVFWVAPRADARLGFSLFDGPLSLFAKVGFAVPLDPRRFVFEANTAAGAVTLVHEVAPVALRGFIGSELQL